MFESKNVAKIKTHILGSIICFPRKSCRVCDIVETYDPVRPDRPQMDIHSLCALNAGILRQQTHTQDM
jgi:hypothetical protein